MQDHKSIYTGLACPTCKRAFTHGVQGREAISCSDCHRTYPIITGIPILLDEAKSIFSISDFTKSKNLYFDISLSGKIKAAVSRCLPGLVTGNSGYALRLFIHAIKQRGIDRPRILVIGGSVLGGGMKQLLSREDIELVESDVSFGPRTQIILDAHDIPYVSESFDGVIAQAVLEHVIDPQRCVSEIHRVLKSEGAVYSEIPFMQQVHGGAYDFTRFSLSGHRRLFNMFSEIKCDSLSGSGSAFAWAYQYLLLGLFGYTESLRYIVKVLARITGFWMKYLDYIEVLNPRKTDGACATYFIGTKSERAVSDKTIIDRYTNRS